MKTLQNFSKDFGKSKQEDQETKSKEAAKDRLHLVLLQDRANVSADFLELMKQEIIDVIKKYIEVDEDAIDVRLTNKTDENGINGVPALYANIPIKNIKNEARKIGSAELKDKSENNNKQIEEKTENNEEQIEEIKEEQNKEKEIKEETIKINNEEMIDKKIEGE